MPEEQQRELVVRRRFECCRLEKESLAAAYEQVVPEIRRSRFLMMMEGFESSTPLSSSEVSRFQAMGD